MKKFLPIIILLLLPWQLALADGATTNQAAPCKADPTTGQTVCTLPNPLASDTTDVRQLIGLVIKSVLGIVGSLALLMLVWGGFQWLTSAGNVEKVEHGTQTMIWAVIGLVIVLASYMLVNIILGLITGSG